MSDKNILQFDELACAAQLYIMINGASFKQPKSTAPSKKALKRNISKKNAGPVGADLPRARREVSDSTLLPNEEKRNILITSALPYVNNVPHLGNIIGCVLSADVYARFCRQRGYNTLYVCGTDEYGTATESKAQAEGLTPRGICDKYHQVHKGIYEWFDISFDTFGRTSCPDPRNTPDWPQTQIAQDIFTRLSERGLLQEQVVEQMYCAACGKFLADRFIEGTCPKCQYADARGDQCDACGSLLNATELLQPRCKVDASHSVEVRTSEHLFLDLPALESRLQAWIETSSAGSAQSGATSSGDAPAAGESKAAATATADGGGVSGWSDNSLQVTQSWIRDGLKPRCITRDLKWGTPVPMEKFSEKVFYVWFDAPIGYISITANYSSDWQQWWKNPENVELVQFMGKDNIPFHTVIFPSSLIGADDNYTLLTKISTTEYLNYEMDPATGKPGKFSKSRNTGVFGDQAKATGIPSEVWRYYLLVNRPEASDSVFLWSDFADKNNNELLKNLGNFVNRALNFAFAKFDGCLPAVDTSQLQPRDTELIEAVDGALSRYLAALESVSIKEGLKQAMSISRLGNGYLQSTQPWELFKTDLPRCRLVVGVAGNLVRLLAAIMEPYMPGFTDKVVHQLNLPHMDIPDAFGFTIAADHPLNQPHPLFRKIMADEVAEFKANFGRGFAASAEEAKSGGGGKGKKGKKGKGGGKKGGKGGNKKGGGGGAAAAAGANAEDCARLDLRVGVIRRAWVHEGADKLYCEEIDVGDVDGDGNPVTRNIASGLRAHYSLEEMQGQRVVVIANLPPRPLVGFQSHGMVLCGWNADHTKAEFVVPPEGAAVGERISFPGHQAPLPEVQVLKAKRKKIWERVQKQFVCGEDGTALMGDAPFTTSAGPCTLASVRGGEIS